MEEQQQQDPELRANYWARIPGGFYRNELPWTDLIGGLDQKPSKHYDSFGVTLTYWPLKLERDTWFDQFRRRFCLHHPERVRIGLIKGQGLLLPHRDHGIGATLNVYLKAQGTDTTAFYKPRSDQVKGHKAPGANQANIYDPLDLIKLGQFSVETNDCVLLNSQAIHSVKMTSDEPRILLSLMWAERTYQEVLADLDDYNSTR